MVRRRRVGFTLIELLVVLGIILVLMGLGVIAFSKLDSVASGRATLAQLQVCASIEGDYEASQSLAVGIEGTGGSQIYALGTTIGNPGDVNPGSGGRFGTGIYNTGKVYQQFAQVNSAQTLLAQLPGSAMLSAAATGVNSLPTPFYDSSGKPMPVVVDAWSNPIIFVPSGGLSGVTFGGKAVTVRSANKRPFWASAGQDGDFSLGDDNLYSCAVVYH